MKHVVHEANTFDIKLNLMHVSDVASTNVHVLKIKMNALSCTCVASFSNNCEADMLRASGLWFFLEGSVSAHINSGLFDFAECEIFAVN